MRAIADAEQAGPPPALQPVDRNGQQLDVLPALQLVDPVAQKRRQAQDLAAKRVQATGAHLVVTALADHERALPVIAAVEGDEQAAVIETAGGLRRVPR